MQVGLSGPLRVAADGEESINIEAETIRELLTRLQERYPAMKQHMEIGIAVSINGMIYRDNWSTRIPADADVYLLPRIAGG